MPLDPLTLIQKLLLVVDRLLFVFFGEVEIKHIEIEFEHSILYLHRLRLCETQHILLLNPRMELNVVGDWDLTISRHRVFADAVH